MTALDSEVFMRRIHVLSALGLFALLNACGDDAGSGGSGGSGGSTSSSTTTGSTTTGSTTTGSTTTGSTTSGMGGAGGSGGSGGAGGSGGSGGAGGSGGSGGSMPTGETNCLDDMDDDSDGDVDCIDTDCAEAAVCGTLVINEIDYDNPGADDFEFIEILNTGSTTVDLSTVTIELVNGNMMVNAVYGTEALGGALAPGEYAVVADPGVTVAPTAVVFALGTAPQNGSPDGLALYDTAHGVVLDALSYEGSITTANIDGSVFDLVEGTATTAVDDGSGVSALVRIPDGSDTNVASVDWLATTVLTPGSANLLGEICDNVSDDDGDTFADCADSDCTGSPLCLEVCDDGQDNNMNGQVDCDEGSCNLQGCGANGLVCMGTTCACPGGMAETSCSDSVDDDCDGQLDCADADCAAACAENCTDNTDNNGNGLVDCADPLCDTLSCGPNGLTCASNLCSCPGGSGPETVCNDAIDDDCDGHTDCGDTDCAASCAPPNLFFSEYVEGTMSNKALEIFNAGATSVDLSTCSLERYANGSATPFVIALSGTLAAGDVFVICNNNMGSLPAASCDAFNTNVSQSGDDAFSLVCNATTLDVIGQIGFDPGTEWGTGLTSTADNTLRRICSVTSGDSNGADTFDPAAQWVGFATDTFDGLGLRACPNNP
jgi:hypothetical protein